MRKRLFYLFIPFLLAFATTASSLLSDVDEYWISYSGCPPQGSQKPAGGPKYLMKIDALGNVLVPPTRVFSNSMRLGFFSYPSATAISHNNVSGGINLWFQSIKGPRANEYPVLRAVIEKRTLRLTSIRRTALVTSDTSHLQVTQRGQDDFLTLQARNPDNSHSQVAYPLSVSGAVSGPKWLLNNTACFECGSRVSSDGRAFVYSDDKIRIMIQPLGPNGRPSGKAIMVDEGLRIRDPFDVSSMLPLGRRFVVYEGNAGIGIIQPLCLRVMDMRTGTRISNRIVIGSGVGHFQPAAIDPLGRFVVYFAGGFYPNYYHLVYQALDATGRRSGMRKTISEKDVCKGVDILKD